MDWQDDTVAELHKVTWTESFFPSLVWNGLHSEMLPAKWKAHGRCVVAVAFEFSIKESGKESSRYQTPSYTKVCQAGAAFRNLRVIQNDTWNQVFHGFTGNGVIVF